MVAGHRGRSVGRIAGSAKLRYSAPRRVGWRPSFEVHGLRPGDAAPVPRGRLLTDREVELTAAHEMGHALGSAALRLKERDVMYPRKHGVVILSARDYRTLEAVYRIPERDVP